MEAVVSQPHRVIYQNVYRRYTTKICATQTEANQFAEDIQISQKDKGYDIPIVQNVLEPIPDFTKFQKKDRPLSLTTRVKCKCGMRTHSISVDCCFSCSGLRDVRRE